jgi:hypothetical protein
MPVHSTILSELEYELHKSVVLSSILINVVDISSSILNPSGTSHEAWKLLLDQNMEKHQIEQEICVRKRLQTVKWLKVER